MSGVTNKEMETMRRISVTGTTRLGFLPVIDGKTIESAPAYVDPEHTTIWATGYLAAKDEAKGQ